MYLKLTRQIIDILGFVISFHRSSVQISNSTRAQEAVQSKLDEIPVLIEMRNSWEVWKNFSLNTSETTRVVPSWSINKDQQSICNRVFYNNIEIEAYLRLLTEPGQFEQENYATDMGDALQKMVMTERDEKLCYNFYGKLLDDIQYWLNEVNVSHSITLDETYDFELMSQVRIESYTNLHHASYFVCIV